jgi:Ca2+:H+ antiporter
MADQVALAGVTVLVALVSEISVESVQEAAVAFGDDARVCGFIVAALGATILRKLLPFG